VDHHQQPRRHPRPRPGRRPGDPGPALTGRRRDRPVRPAAPARPTPALTARSSEVVAARRHCVGTASAPRRHCVGSTGECAQAGAEAHRWSLPRTSASGGHRARPGRAAA
jgi:hypothetical protein